jgi:hypothetical protein
MSLQFILQLESTTCASIKLHAGISCHGQCLLVSREGMVGDRVVEEMVNLWGCHIFGFWIDRRSSLLSMLARKLVDLLNCGG